MENDPNAPVLTFLLVGDVSHQDFLPWMERHAGKLGVAFHILRQSQNETVLQASGAPQMTHAFALASSLGPHGVLVDHLHILEEAENF